MASSSKRKGSVKTLEWWKHLRYRKREQNKLVRRDGKKQIQERDRDRPVPAHYKVTSKGLKKVDEFTKPT
jgi:hypothetical protein